MKRSQINLRIPATEREKLEFNAKSLNFNNISEYIRHVALNPDISPQKPEEVTVPPDLKYLKKELTSVGVLLNQIARAMAYQQNYLCYDNDALLQETLNYFSDICQRIKKIEWEMLNAINKF